MTIKVPLMKADTVDACGDKFTAEACQAVVDQWHKDKAVVTVARDFTPTPRPVGRVLDLSFDGAIVWVTLDDDAKALIEAEGLEAAAGGYHDKSERVDGVQTIKRFTLDRIALVADKVS